MFEGNDSELEGVMYSRQLQSVLDVCCTSLVARCVVWSGVEWCVAWTLRLSLVLLKTSGKNILEA